MHYHFQIHEDEDGLWAECLELEGCRTQADSREELEVNMREALELYLDEPVGTNLVHPQPASSPPEECVKVPVSPEAALPMLLRGCRISRRMSQEEMRRTLGLKHRTEYARLERRCNPTLSRLARITDRLRDFPIEALRRRVFCPFHII